MKFWRKICVSIKFVSAIKDIKNRKINSSFSDIKTCFAILRYVGMWQNCKQSWKYFAYGLFIQIFYVFAFVICHTINTILTMENENGVENLAFIILNLSAFAKQINFFIKIDKIEKLHSNAQILMSEAEKLNKESRASHSSTSSKLSYQLFKAYLTFGFMGAFSFVLGALATGNIPVWLPFDTSRDSLGFKIAVVHLFINVLIILPIDICLKFMPILFMSKAIDCLEMLEKKLKTIHTDGADSDPREDLIVCIKIHTKIRDYVNDIQEVFGSIMFILSATTMMILSLYAINMAKVSLKIM